MPKRGKKRRERRKRSEERDMILRLTGCNVESRNTSRAGDLREYAEDLMRLFGRFSFSVFLASYLFHRFGDHLEWKDTAAANLLRLRESKGIEELKTALKHMFPHVNDKLIWNAMIDEKFDGISAAERILSLSADAHDKGDKDVSVKSKKLELPTSFFVTPRVKRCDVVEESPRRRIEKEYLFHGSPRKALQKAKELRSRAQDLHGRMVGKFQDAKKHNSALRSTFVSEGYDFRDEKLRCQREASQLIFYGHNNRMYPDEIDFEDIEEKEPLIDLHGLHVNEAIEYAKLAMKAAKRSRFVTRIRFLTGRGMHSGPDGPRILPALSRYFSSSHRLDHLSDALVVYK